MNKWARPLDWNRGSAASAGLRSSPAAPHYFAFLSYSHSDADDADWLHEQLERFRVPPSLAGKLGATGVIPKRLTPIFRDRQELAAADDLGEEIREALAVSRCLIVLCSPAAAQSKWTNAEIDAFKRLHPDGCIIAAVIAGEPLASERGGGGDGGEECFPPALRQKYDRRGRPTGKAIEPLAADLRAGHGSRRTGFLKIVAGILGVGLDELVKREQLRRQRRLAGISAGSFIGMLVAGGLAITAIQARDSARDQRREAESLVEFMLGDLKEKLEPIGKLDALDGVGSRVLGYYSKQDTAQLSDSGLVQRSRALSLMAEVAYVRGNLDVAQRLYREAFDGTAEAIRRNPDDPQRLFDHAQNVFWTADIARQRGQTKEAENGMREYKRLADQMVSLDPNNMKWRMEQQSADTNLGILLFEERHFQEAMSQLTRALKGMEALATADPDNREYLKSTTELQTWLADATMSEGQLDEALAMRQRLVGRLRELLDRSGDVEYRQKLVPAERHFGELYLYRGQINEALQQFEAAVGDSESLVAREPANSRWRYFSVRARINLAEGLLAAGRADGASAATEAACASTTRLLSTDAEVQIWRATLRDCWQLRSRAGLASGHSAQALKSAQRAIEVGRTVRSTDRVDDAYAQARSYRLLGDAWARLHDSIKAAQAWQAALAMLPGGVAEKPPEMAERALLLDRMGRSAELEPLKRRLATIGFRQPRA